MQSWSGICLILKRHLQRRGRMPKPLIDVDDAKLKLLMKMKPTLADTSAFLDVSDETITRYIRRTYNQSWLEFRT